MIRFDAPLKSFSVFSSTLPLYILTRGFQRIGYVKYRLFMNRIKSKKYYKLKYSFYENLITVN